MVTRGTRAPMAQNSSYGMVSHRSDRSCAVVRSPPCSPRRTTSSPTRAPGTSVASIIIMSMQTVPTCFTRRPPSSTSVLFVRLRRYPSAYPTGSVAGTLSRRAVQRWPYEIGVPAGTRLRCEIPVTQLIAGFRSARPAKRGAGTAPYSIRPGRTMSWCELGRSIVAALFARWLSWSGCPASSSALRPSTNSSIASRAEVAQREPLLHERDPQPVRAGLQEGLGRDGGSVAVAVRLHHRHHAAAGRRLARLAEVVHQGMCVDARLGGPDAQIESAAGGIAQGCGGGFGHARPPGRNCSPVQDDNKQITVGFPARAG